MTGFWIAPALGVVSALCYGGGAVLQAGLARRLGTRPRAGRAAALGAVLEHPLWWPAVGLTLAGALLHLVALRFGPLIAVQPLGTLALVFALPWSARSAARRVSPREWHGAALTVAGLSVLLLATAPAGADTRLDPAEATAVLGAAAAVMAGCAWCAPRLRRPWRALALATAAGVAFGAASALAKSLSTEPPAGVAAAVSDSRLLGTALLAAAGMLLAQAAYRGMDVGAPLAAMSLANPAAAIAVGVCFMGERYAAGLWGVGVSTLAAIVAVRGVLLLAVPPAPRAPSPPASRGHPARG